MSYLLWHIYYLVYTARFHYTAWSEVILHRYLMNSWTHIPLIDLRSPERSWAPASLLLVESPGNSRQAKVETSSQRPALLLCLTIHETWAAVWMRAWLMREHELKQEDNILHHDCSNILLPSSSFTMLSTKKDFSRFYSLYIYVCVCVYTVVPWYLQEPPVNAKIQGCSKSLI